MTRSLVIGATGYIGSNIAKVLSAHGIDVQGSSRQPRPGYLQLFNGPDLDRVSARYDQIVLTAQLTEQDADWLIDRVDGPRWLVFSSMQLAAAVPAPNTEVALAREAAVLARGACVIRPTMVFGRGGDRNVSQIARQISRWRVSVQLGKGRQLLQPVHVDDVAQFVLRHACRPTPGRFEIGGDEAITAEELRTMVVEIVGRRCIHVGLPESLATHLAPLAPVLGLRSDQLRRLHESKVANIAPASSTFEWEPEPTGNRVEQAVREAFPCR